MYLVSLCHKEIRNMSPNPIFVANSIASKHFLKPIENQIELQKPQRPDTYVLELMSARSQFCLLIIEIISGAAFP